MIGPRLITPDAWAVFNEDTRPEIQRDDAEGLLDNDVEALNAAVWFFLTHALVHLRKSRQPYARDLATLAEAILNSAQCGVCLGDGRDRNPNAGTETCLNCSGTGQVVSVRLVGER